VRLFSSHSLVSTALARLCGAQCLTFQLHKQWTQVRSQLSLLTLFIVWLKRWAQFRMGVRTFWSAYHIWIIYITSERGGPEVCACRPHSRVDLAPKISWSHTLRLFLVEVRNRSSLCTTVPQLRWTCQWRKISFFRCAMNSAKVFMLSMGPEGGTLNIYKLYCEYNQIYFISYLSLLLCLIYRLTKLSLSFWITLYWQYYMPIWQI
jgi:hypothetical protein